MEQGEVWVCERTGQDEVENQLPTSCSVSKKPRWGGRWLSVCSIGIQLKWRAYYPERSSGVQLPLSWLSIWE